MSPHGRLLPPLQEGPFPCLNGPPALHQVTLFISSTALPWLEIKLFTLVLFVYFLSVPLPQHWAVSQTPVCSVHH